MINIKLIFSVFFVLFSFVFFAQSKLEDDLLVWSEAKRLSWEDFQGKPDFNTEYLAETSSYISMDFHQVNLSEAKINIVTFFSKSESWNKIESSYLLSHEQLHFDIKELYSRKLRKSISEAKFDNIKELRSICISLHDKCEKSVNNLQSLYDKETNHSKNEVKQIEWNNQIKKQLDSLKDYSNPVLIISTDW